MLQVQYAGIAHRSTSKCTKHCTQGSSYRLYVNGSVMCMRPYEEQWIKFHFNCLKQRSSEGIIFQFRQVGGQTGCNQTAFVFQANELDQLCSAK